MALVVRNMLLDDRSEAIVERLDAFSAECVLEDFDEDDESVDAGDLAPAPRFIPSLEKVNETTRSGAARIDQERPQ